METNMMTCFDDERKILYHGSKNPNLVPIYGGGRENNDYGNGLYTTPEKELGREWAYASYTAGDVGYLYTYSLDMNGLKVLDLTELSPLNWIAELLTNRKVNTNEREGLQDTVDAFLSRYKLDTSEYDVIIGYRADDSYFSYATDFVSGFIYLDTLEIALKNGDLGIQYFVKSKRAFDRLSQVGEPEIVDAKYRGFYLKRDKNAREKYKRDRMNQVSRKKQRIFDFI